MKNLGTVIVASILSAFLAIVAYHFLIGPPAKEVIVRESAPASFTNFNAEETAVNSSPRKFLSSSPTNFIAAAEAVTPAVVNIKASIGSDNDWWGGGFNGSSGSGVIISPEGYIVTNNHVIEDGKTIEVTLDDRRQFEAKVLGIDPSTDLALIKIDGRKLPYLTLGNSDSIRVGEWVLAVGNPFNLASTVTAGIVSAKGRSIDILEDAYKVESFIQTDAAVNPGNSGGALVNTNGELIGINTAIITRSGRYEGYSFAIPSNLAKKVVNDIRDYGTVQRAILGVSIDPVTSELAENLGLGSVEGVYISSVTKKSGAEDAGIKRGDVILKINGTKTKSIPELQEQVARFRPGKTVEVEYWRNNKKVKTDVVLKNISGTTSLVGDALDRGPGMIDGGLAEQLGFELRNLTSSERRKLDTKGVYVASISRGSKIDRTNMDPGFIITKINDKRVTNVKDAMAQLRKAEDKVMLEGIYEGYPDVWYYAFPK